MTDVLTTAQRSHNMRRIRSKDTAPERAVRSLVHAMGFRFRLHGRDLPGKPDIVLSRLKRVIFIHGCFWHCHRCRYGRVKPATNSEFWSTKREGNRMRDRRNIRRLRADGWKVLVIWECWLRDVDVKVVPRLKRFFAGCE